MILWVVSNKAMHEFVHVPSGTATLVTDSGRHQLTTGMCAGFAAGTGNAHQLFNESDAPVLYLEIGDRTPGDQVSYPDDDCGPSGTSQCRIQAPCTGDNGLARAPCISSGQAAPGSAARPAIEAANGPAGSRWLRQAIGSMRPAFSRPRAPAGNRPAGRRFPRSRPRRGSGCR